MATPAGDIPRTKEYDSHPQPCVAEDQPNHSTSHTNANKDFTALGDNRIDNQCNSHDIPHSPNPLLNICLFQQGADAMRQYGLRSLTMMTALLLTFAARPPAAEAAHQIALGRGGTLQGQLLGPRGSPLAGSLVTVRQGKHRVIRTVTNSQGHFTAQGLRGGTTHVSSSHGSSSFVSWAPGTAPPVAQSGTVVFPPPNHGGRGFEQRVLNSLNNFDDHISLSPPKPPASEM